MATVLISVSLALGACGWLNRLIRHTADVTFGYHRFTFPRFPQVPIYRPTGSARIEHRPVDSQPGTLIDAPQRHRDIEAPLMKCKSPCPCRLTNCSACLNICSDHCGDAPLFFSNYFFFFMRCPSCGLLPLPVNSLVVYHPVTA